MRASKFFILSLTVILLASCSSVRVSGDYTKGTDFQQFKTYKIVQQEENFPVGVNAINQQRIEVAIKATLTEYDYLFADQRPDLLVSYFVKINSKKAYDTYTTYYGGRWRGVMITDVDVREYQEGTLIIDLIDAKTKQVVWHGAATDVVSKDMKNVEEKINEAVGAIFQKYFSQAGLASN